MEYLLFTYPNCSSCVKLKTYLAETALDWQEYSLTQKDSKLRIRDYLQDIKRDEKGGVIIPTLIVQDDEGVSTVLNSQEELDDWLRSRG